MQRIPEPELMNDAEQARAYARADFSEPHQFFVECFQRLFPARSINGTVLDLGCGPADVSMRFARAYPECTIHGIDGAEAMLEQGHQLLRLHGLASRIALYRVCLPQDAAPFAQYDAIISNSLLHHLHDPHVMWDAIKRYRRPGTPVFVMDLQRPDTPHRARQLVEQYATTEPEVLQRDFYHSLCAAFSPAEVEQQLQDANLTQLTVESISDRHLIVHGNLDG